MHSETRKAPLEDQTQVILFDLDGTLIDTTDLILRCFQHSWERVLGFNHSREALLQTFGTPLRDAMNCLLLTNDELDRRMPKGKPNPDLVDRLLAEYRSFNIANHDHLATPFEGTIEVLSELRRRGYLIGVVTSKSRELALRGLRLCGLDELIHAAVFLEDTDSHKPNPEPILTALQKLSAPCHRAAYIGDSPHDMVAARAAGVATIAALWGPAPKAELEREKPDFMAESIIDLLELFNRREPIIQQEHYYKDATTCQV